METYKGFKVGDRVHVKVTDDSYDNQGDITPDMLGTIKNFAPKVRIIKRPPLLDGLPYFAYVEFDKIADEVHQNHFRGGIDICNIRRVP
jgi:hypothetical protein